jgi:ubiquinol-cytochrome c reductase cytochrome b subunit
LATNSFTYEDCMRLVQVLYDLYGLKAIVQSAGVSNQYVIYIWKESMPQLQKLVRPYMISSMLYKLGDF